MKSTTRQASLPQHVAVYGGGTMGVGIAHVFLAGGSRVTLVELDAQRAAAARGSVAAGLARAHARGRLLVPVEAVMDRLTCTADVDDLAGVDLVVEAVTESLSLKQIVLRRAAQAAPEAALATNTSALSIDQLAEGLPDPGRLVGLHFFNPVPASSMVEIVVGRRTSGWVADAARNWVGRLGKAAIVVRDAPGFASSRLGVLLALEAMRMVDEGVASAEDIDAAMTLGYQHPVGPLRTSDLVGLDVRLAIAEHLERELGPRFAPPAVLRAKVAAGELGRQTGRGFFVW